MMTVNSLIKRLEKYPKDMRIVIDGYEGGVDYASKCTEIEIATNVNSEHYLGRHEALDSYNVHEYEDYKKIKVVRIG